MLYPTWDRALVSLSPGGSDACIVREFDIESRASSRTASSCPMSASTASRGSIATRCTSAGTTARTARNPRSRPPAFRARRAAGSAARRSPTRPSCSKASGATCRRARTTIRSRSCTLASRAVTFYETLQLLARRDLGRMAAIRRAAARGNRALERLALRHAARGLERRRHALRERHAARHPARRVSRRARAISPCSSRRRDGSVLADIDFTKHWLIVSQMDDGAPRVALLRPPAEADGDVASARLRAAGREPVVRRFDRFSERDDTVLIHVEHFLTPPSLYYADLANDAPWTTARAASRAVRRDRASPPCAATQRARRRARFRTG